MKHLMFAISALAGLVLFVGCAYYPAASDAKTASPDQRYLTPPAQPARLLR